MLASEDVVEDLTSLSMGAVPYKTFVSQISEASPGLQSLQSLSLGLESGIERSVAISKFAYLLSALSVPGPCDLISEYSPLGHGAQFKVVKQRVGGLVDSGTSVSTSVRNSDIAAVKMPIFLLHDQQKLDLSSPGVNRQVRNMIIEITALCHPSLRDHRNIVDLWGWGTKEVTEVPFLALEVANNTLTTFLCESRFAPIALKHHIAVDIGCGLDALHEIGLIHGDLKPENVLMFYRAGHWVAKLADFGGGADLGQGGDLEGRGTVGWRAPELRQFFDDGTHIDRSLLDKIDNYSYGLLLWSIFLRDKGSAPCTENVEAEIVALSELQTNLMSLPMSLQSVLKSSLSLLLKQDPRKRTKSVGHLLDDGSRVYSEWILLNSSKSEKISEYNTTVALPQGYAIQYGGEVPDSQRNDVWYDWEIPEISWHNVKAVQSAYSRDEPITTEMIHSLFMKYAGSQRLVHHTVSPVRDHILDLLYTGSKKGSQSLRALIYIVHEYFQILPGADLLESKLLWMSEAVASGAFFLRESLENLDSSLLDQSIRTFQDHGGYNQHYAELDQEAVSETLLRTSIENVIHCDWKMSLNRRGDRLLHILSSTTAFGDLEQMVKPMSSQEVNRLNDCGETALYRACMAGATAHVLLLLSHDADPSIAPSQDGPTCLHWLFHFSPRDVDIIAQELVAHGAPLHSQCEWKLPMLHYPFTLPVGTPLHWAVENSAVEATRSLIRQGADPSVRDGSDPYAYNDNVRHLEMRLPPDNILYSNAEHSTLGFNAIEVAVKNRNPEILATLLSNDPRIDPGDTDEEGYNAVHRLDAGEWLYTNQGSPVWHRLFQGPPCGQADLLKKTIAILLRNGFKLDRLTNRKKESESRLGFSGQTALMIAVSHGNTETIKQLLDAGADVNIANSEGETALLSFTDHYYVDKDNKATGISLLLDANANLNVPNNSGETPLIRAAALLIPRVATTLLNHGADFRSRVMNTTSRRFGRNAFALMTECTSKTAAKIDEWLVTQLKTHILPRIAATGGSALHNELLEKADLDGGTLLHYTAQHGLIRSSEILLESKVGINNISRRQWGRRGVRDEFIFRTALDDAEYGLKNCDMTIPGESSEERQASGRADRKGVFRDIVELLRKAGAVESKHLIAKHFNIPPLERGL